MNVLKNGSINMVMSCGMLCVLLVGSIDISITAILAFVGCVAGKLMGMGVIESTFVMFILGIGNFLSTNFEQLYAFYNPLVHDTIQTLSLYSYKVAMERNNYSLSTALSISNTLVSVVLLVFANLLAKKVRGETIL